jgi:hypothetical protein
MHNKPIARGAIARATCHGSNCASPLRSTTEVDYIRSALTTKVNIIVLVLSNDEKSQVVGVSRMNA